MNSDWRENMVAVLVQMCKDSGMVMFSEDAVLQFMLDLADKERGKHESKRVGFAFAVDNYKSSGISQIVNKVRASWSDYQTKELPVDEVSKFRCRCVLSVKLSRPADPSSLQNILSAYVLGCQELFECAVERCAHSHDLWYDVLIQYTDKLSEIYKTFSLPEWITDIVTKPLSDYGKRTITTFGR